MPGRWACFDDIRSGRCVWDRTWDWPQPGIAPLSTSNNDKLTTDWPALDGTIGITPNTVHCIIFHCDKSRLTSSARQNLQLCDLIWQLSSLPTVTDNESRTEALESNLFAKPTSSSTQWLVCRPSAGDANGLQCLVQDSVKQWKYSQERKCVLGFQLLDFVCL